MLSPISSTPNQHGVVITYYSITVKLMDNRSCVIPAPAGIQGERVRFLDARLRGHDGMGYITIMLTGYYPPCPHKGRFFCNSRYYGHFRAP